MPLKVPIFSPKKRREKNQQEKSQIVTSVQLQGSHMDVNSVRMSNPKFEKIDIGDAPVSNAEDSKLKHKDSVLRSPVLSLRQALNKKRGPQQPLRKRDSAEPILHFGDRFDDFTVKRQSDQSSQSSNIYDNGDSDCDTLNDSSGSINL
ncbi:unnamed protein product [Dimorphilus gyrociliatus]|uniref:Uncharacterized protein n=1 Tax=Dimorphilus gyrociliatus TaxID=2664684 RepID=A0A7I8V9D6_9ANNE|nr:unnamed protein product [Dimorphilus gyrociliatus]